jgi:CHASE2 domain-containing sensor protein
MNQDTLLVWFSRYIIARLVAIILLLISIVLFYKGFPVLSYISAGVTPVLIGISLYYYLHWEQNYRILDTVQSFADAYADKCLQERQEKLNTPDIKKDGQ